MQTLIYFDESEYLNKKAFYEHCAELLQVCVDAYISLKNSHQLKSEPVLENNELARILTDTKGLVFDCLSGGSVSFSFGSLQLNRAKAMQLVDMPEGFNALEASVSALAEYLKTNVAPLTYSNLSLSSIASYYTLESNVKVCLLDSVDKKLEMSCKIFATSERANKMLELANIIKDKIKDLGIEPDITNNPEGFGAAMNTILKTDRNKKIVLNVDYLKRYNTTEVVKI